jgi:RsiW-degrading membrane proteinase PrsW (M82 family)
MVEPVEAKDIMIAAMAGAMVIMFGAGYAFAFAMAKLNKQRSVMAVAYALYAGLVISVFVLAYALNLNGSWWAVTITMLVGYLLAPQAIWKLSVGTHESSDTEINK